MVLLQNSLSFLHWGDSIAALSELSEELKDRSDPRTLSLNQLGRVVVYNYMCISQVLLAISICPNLSINKMEIVCSTSVTDLMLRILVSLPMMDLREISFVGCDNSTVTFEHGIVPVLVSIGVNLQKLGISNFEVVDPLVVASKCPNLKSVKFVHNRSYVGFDIPNVSPNIEHLNYLEKFCCDVKEQYDMIETPITENHLSFFLGSPRLKDIRIYSCMTLTDAVIENAFRKTKFENLSLVFLAYCGSITNHGLNFFKRDENSISYFSVTNCFQADINLLKTEWESVALEKKWIVETDFENDIEIDLGEEENEMQLGD